MLKKIKIGLNGFGRIGRAITKINLEHDYFDLVLINDINPYVENLAYLFKYDSTYGSFPGTVESSENKIKINGKEIICTSCSKLNTAPWEEHDVSIIIDASGVESNIDDAKEIVKQGKVQKVIITHSSTETDNEIIMGVNDELLTKDHHVVSSSICDANALAHIMKWIDNEYGIINGSITTLHPWLSYQNLVDGPSISQSNPGVVWTDYALGRASTDSLIPKNTTAMTATEKILPQLKDKILSFSYRIPTDIVASLDITINLQCNVTTKEVVDFLQKKCDQSPYVRANMESLVSLDYEQEESSSIIDMQWTKAVNNVVKIVLWYDNEWGYSARVLDLAKKLSEMLNND